jgi:hypothetical protein
MVQRPVTMGGVTASSIRTSARVLHPSWPASIQPDPNSLRLYPVRFPSVMRIWSTASPPWRGPGGWLGAVVRGAGVGWGHAGQQRRGGRCDGGGPPCV